MHEKRRMIYMVTTIVLVGGGWLLQSVDWQGDSSLHTLMELAATLLAFFVGAMALIRFFSRRDELFLYIGAGFLGTAMLDGFHAVVTSVYFQPYMPSDNPHLVPWSWIASRLFLSSMMFVSWLLWFMHRNQTNFKPNAKAVLSFTAIATLGAFLFFATVPLASVSVEDGPIYRPAELLPAFFLLLALAGYLNKGAWRDDQFEHWLVLSLIVGFATQTVFMPFSGALYDTEFNLAHLLKKLSYILVLIGLLNSLFLTYKELKSEIKNRKEVENALLESHGQLQRTNAKLVQAAEKIKESEERFRNLANAAPTLIWTADKNKQCNWFNDTWLSYTGRTMEQECGNGWAEGVHPDDLDRCLEIYVSNFDLRQPFSMEYRLRNHRGEYCWFIDVGRPRFDEHGEFAGYIGMLTDINDRKETERSMRLAQFSLDNADEEIFWIDWKGKILDANSRACKALGYSKEELITLSVADVDTVYSGDKWPAHWQELKEKGVLRFESAHRARDGKTYPTEILANYFEHEGNEYNCAFVRDISVRKQLEEELKRQARIDFLTGLRSRGYFMELAEQELSRAIRYETPLSIIMMDVDFFKQVNDRHGHKTGDAVLIKLAEVCRRTLRDVDIIGRIGGEEFAILLPQTAKEEAAEVAERLRGMLAKAKVPLSAGGLPIHFTVSLGLTSLASKEDNMDVLLNLADKALYKAKNSGRNRVCVE